MMREEDGKARARSLDRTGSSRARGVRGSCRARLRRTSAETSTPPKVRAAGPVLLLANRARYRAIHDGASSPSSADPPVADVIAIAAAGSAKRTKSAS